MCDVRLNGKENKNPFSSLFNERTKVSRKTGKLLRDCDDRGVACSMV